MMESLGQLLQQARQARGISIETAAQATHIRLHYLQAIEADDIVALPSAVQARGFIRLYAGYLDLNPEELLQSRPAEPAPEDPPAEIKKAPAKKLSWIRKKQAPAGEPSAVESPADDLSNPAVPGPNGENSPETVSTSVDARAGRDTVQGSENAPAGTISAPPTAESEARPAGKTAAPGAEAARPARKSVYPVGPTHTAGKSQGGTRGPVSTESHAILVEIGQTLTQRREVLGLTPADIEHYTHIRIHYVQALEEGRIDEFLSPVQARGMLSNYARFMNLEVDTLLLRFADALQTRRVENLSPQKAQRPPAQVVPLFSLRRFFTVDLIAGSLLIIAMVAFLFWGVSQVLDYRSSLDATPSLPAVVDVLAPSETPGMTMTPGVPNATNADITNTPQSASATPTPPAEATVLVTVPPSASSSSLQLYVIAKEQVWLRIIVDGTVAFQGRTSPGAAYNFAGSKEISLTTGNAAGLQVLFNQSDLGVLGAYAQVVNLIFDANGVQTPTPLPPPTSTITPLVSPTLGSSTKTTPAGTTPTGTRAAPTWTPAVTRTSPASVTPTK